MMNKYKKKIISLQRNRGVLLFWDEECILDERGEGVTIEDETLNLNSNLCSLELGKCGELYAHYILNELGWDTYDVLVDNRGIDLIAKKNMCLKIQVKAVRNSNYAYIKERSINLDNRFYLFYVWVSCSGVPRAYLFPMAYVVKKIKDNDGNYLCFYYRQYKGMKSDSEFGISGAKKIFDEPCNKNVEENISSYLLAEGWNVKYNRIEELIKLNENIEID